MSTINVVIMAGGSGTRFWPLSQEILPKQFISLFENETLIQRTYRLYRKWLSPDQIFVATSRKYGDIVHEQLPELPSDQLILEPASRDTAASIALTARHFLSLDRDNVLVFAPSDHYILHENHLMQSLLRAADVVQEEPLAIVTLGVMPTRPETGYGYIRRKAFPKRAQAYEVLSFVEKPDKAHAEALLKEQVYCGTVELSCGNHPLYGITWVSFNQTYGIVSLKKKGIWNIATRNCREYPLTTQCWKRPI